MPVLSNNRHTPVFSLLWVRLCLRLEAAGDMGGTGPSPDTHTPPHPPPLFLPNSTGFTTCHHIICGVLKLRAGRIFKLDLGLVNGPGWGALSPTVPLSQANTPSPFAGSLAAFAQPGASGGRLRPLPLGLLTTGPTGRDASQPGASPGPPPWVGGRDSQLSSSFAWKVFLPSSSDE